MGPVEEFLSKYVDPETGELPPCKPLDPDRVQLMNEHFNQIELEERLFLDQTANIRFIG